MSTTFTCTRNKLKLSCQLNLIVIELLKYCAEVNSGIPY